MNPETSPFSPGQPVPIEFFIGRIREVERLRGMVKASTQGKFRIGFVSGERGIGKSSLASFVRHLSEHESQVAGCHVFLGGVEDLNEMLRRTFDRLLTESMDKPWHEQIRNFFGNHVRQVGLFGITLELNLIDNFLRRMKSLGVLDTDSRTSFTCCTSGWNPSGFLDEGIRRSQGGKCCFTPIDDL